MSVNRIVNAYRLFFGTKESAQILIASVTITNAQIKALPNTPVVLVAAPGANKRIVLVDCDLWLLRTAAAYTNVDATNAWLALQLGGVDYSSYLVNDSGLSRSDLTGFLTTAGDGHGHATLVTWSPIEPTWGAVAYGEPVGNTLVDAALTIYANNDGAGSPSDFTGGNVANSLTARVAYRIVDVP